MEPTYKCAKCKTRKPATEFLVAKPREDSPCRTCHRKQGRVNSQNAYYRNPEKSRKRGRESAKRHRKKNPNRVLFTLAKQRAKDNGIEFTISLDDVVIPTRCPVFDLPLSPSVGFSLLAPTLDRIDNSKGYIPGNVAVISRRANMIKSFGSAEEHERIAVWIRAVTVEIPEKSMRAINGEKSKPSQ